ncbi:hypothetical protein BCD67_01010 [Oscillatoriales cyanobacterium USR001]|nr:hypothetical protein BCD67_01010 [Oscillatoriales cyanobacterium USR001]
MEFSNSVTLLDRLDRHSNQDKIAKEMLIAIDSRIKAPLMLAAGVLTGAKVIILDIEKDGIEQISEALADTNLSNLHIICHGEPGCLYLGKTPLTSANLTQYRHQLTPGRLQSIHLYSCNVAAGETGANFLQQLHTLTGANIAASANPIGSAELGGDWNLEVQIGSIETSVPINHNTLKTYSGVLGFAPKVNFPNDKGPAFVSIGDFNGDSKPDLAVSSYYDSNVSVLLNTTPTGDTTPTFAPKVTIALPTGSNPFPVSIGDFNGDGKPDLAIGNRYGNNVSILLNTTTTGAATPTFATKVDFATGSFPRDISIEDINGDGKPDLVTANFDSDNASILLNTTPQGAATPTFAPQITFPTDKRSASVKIGDINGDGKPDLAVANFGINSLLLFLNTTPTGATTPTFAPQVNLTISSNSASVSIGDINGDGKPDLVTANNGTKNASILLNTTPKGAATPTFAPEVTFPNGDKSLALTLGDLNGDGKPDLAVANSNGNNASILFNTTPTGATTPTFTPQALFPTGDGSASIRIGDLNSDGKPDLVTANFFSDNISILLNNTPKVTAVTATSTDGSYGVGSTIPITVTFDAAVNVTGTPQLQLETGTTDQFANYASGSGGKVLTFNYVVQAGDSTTDLQYLATNSLSLNGGTIKETAATAFDAFLILPELTSAQSLGGSKAIVIDTVAPTANLTSTAGTVINSPFQVTATFSKSVTGFTDTDVSVTNATVSGLSGSGTTYNFTVTPKTDGLVTVNLPSGSVQDAANNNNTAAATLARAYDITAPTVSLFSTSPTITNKPFTVTATFSESVTGFTDTKVNVTNGKVSEFSGNESTYNFTVTPTTDGVVTVNIPGGSFQDIANNNNTASTDLTRTNDTAGPTAKLEPAISSITTGGDTSQTFTVTFSDNNAIDVSSLDSSDIVVNGASGAITTKFVSVTPTTNGTPRTATYSFTPPGGSWDVADNGNYTVSLQKEQVKDTLGNAANTGNLGTFSVDIQTSTLALNLDGQCPTIPSNSSFVNLPSSLSQNGRILGTRNAETLIGTSSADSLFGNSDNDTILGQAGRDSIYAGKGDDLSYGGTEDDQIFGDRGNDTIAGGDGDDLGRGGKGNDLLDGNSGNDLLFGDSGNDTLCGNEGNDTLYGDNDNSNTNNANDQKDYLIGGSGDDLVFGGEAEDTIYGGDGNDSLIGGNANDILVGGAGNDSLVGGSENDVFVLVSGGGSDAIADFRIGQDLIGLAGGLRFSQLTISQGNNGTLIRSGNELLATLEGVQASQLLANSFSQVSTLI